MKLFEFGRLFVKIFLCFLFYYYAIGLIESSINRDVLKIVLGIFSLAASGMALFVFETIDNEEE